jgi:hypothetical protein
MPFCISVLTVFYYRLVQKTGKYERKFVIIRVIWSFGFAAIVYFSVILFYLHTITVCIHSSCSKYFITSSCLWATCFCTFVQFRIIFFFFTIPYWYFNIAIIFNFDCSFNGICIVRDSALRPNKPETEWQTEPQSSVPICNSNSFLWKKSVELQKVSTEDNTMVPKHVVKVMRWWTIYLNCCVWLDMRMLTLNSVAY